MPHVAKELAKHKTTLVSANSPAHTDTVHQDPVHAQVMAMESPYLQRQEFKGVLFLVQMKDIVGCARLLVTMGTVRLELAPRSARSKQAG